MGDWVYLPAAGGLFGGLFGAAPAAPAAPAAGGLFGAPAAAPASEGLFGAPANPFGTLDDMLDAAEKKVMPPDSNPFGVSRSEGAFGTPPPPAPGIVLTICPSKGKAHSFVGHSPFEILKS